MTAHAQDYWKEPRVVLMLWAGMLLGPIGWGINLQTNYALATFACDWPLVLHAVSVVSLAIAATGGLLAWRTWQALEEEDAPRAGDGTGHRIARSRFMAAGGLALSGFFALAIFAQWIPTLFIEPCRY